MKTITLDEAREQLREAEVHYRAVEAKRNQTFDGVATAERVLAQVETQAELEEAARVLLKARETHAEVEKVTTEKRRERGRIELGAVETELVEAVAVAEADMAQLSTSIRRVLELSKRRYAYRQEATGRAPRSLLARNATVGWLAWRLRDLELPGLDHPPHHYRSPLAELLGLTTQTDQETS
jgi:hypothetical protein